MKGNSRALLLKACGVKDVLGNEGVAALAYEIVERLEHLPVAVDLAGAYIGESQDHIDVVSAMRQCLKDYDTNRDRLLKFNAFTGINTYGQTVWTMWNTTLRTIEKRYECCDQRGSVLSLGTAETLSLGTAF